jgi:tetratricopeptide (TPR) repeat protein
MKNGARGLLCAFILIGLNAWGQARVWDDRIAAGQAAMAKGQYAEAEKAFAESLRAAEKLGEKDARFAGSLLRLAEACNAQSKREEAEDFARRSAAAMDKALKALKPKNSTEDSYALDVASASFDKAGDIFASHQKYTDAEELYKRVIAIREGNATEKHTIQDNEDALRLMYQKMAGTQNKLAAADEKLAKLYFSEHKMPEAATLFEKVAQIQEGDKNGAKKPLAITLGNLAACHAVQGNYTQAELLYQRAIALFEQSDWMDKPETAFTMRNYALLLKKTGREEEATAMMERSEAIRKKVGLNPF